jgi:hypothetical protein
MVLIQFNTSIINSNMVVKGEFRYDDTPSSSTVFGFFCLGFKSHRHEPTAVRGKWFEVNDLNHSATDAPSSTVNHLAYTNVVTCQISNLKINNRLGSNHAMVKLLFPQARNFTLIAQNKLIPGADLTVYL